ncbi:hypothetical protein IV38_GL000928 [Lactobacillus selangorensis]|uniref:Uncharacterized protein n=1 Tax=Lactobacillus selangorensis TaxID=81857 RepID=A0A0R2FV61_9LACO|nr:hypothetical protein [Lactobacillus selangorensis]KRN28724.1 hypothetical protein IV38_GL000928 [Lactobacillus selangorensis]KRN32866.1 hypothetical protein IV40_GL000925 [Lactobacillus selangorensis]
MIQLTQADFTAPVYALTALNGVLNLFLNETYGIIEVTIDTDNAVLVKLPAASYCRFIAEHVKGLHLTALPEQIQTTGEFTIILGTPTLLSHAYQRYAHKNVAPEYIRHPYSVFVMTTSILGINLGE